MKQALDLSWMDSSTNRRMLRFELGKSNTDPILPGHFTACNVKLGILHFVDV